MVCGLASCNLSSAVTHEEELARLEGELATLDRELPRLKQELTEASFKARLHPSVALAHRCKEAESDAAIRKEAELLIFHEFLVHRAQQDNSQGVETPFLSVENLRT